MRPEAPVLQRERGGDDARRRLIDPPVAVFDALHPIGGFCRVAELGEEQAMPVVNDRGRRGESKWARERTVAT